MENVQMKIVLMSSISRDLAMVKHCFLISEIIVYCKRKRFNLELSNYFKDSCFLCGWIHQLLYVRTKQIKHLRRRHISHLL